MRGMRARQLKKALRAEVGLYTPRQYRKKKRDYVRTRASR